jgi:hypothetical protein
MGTEEYPENMKGKDNPEDLGIEGKVKWILKK